MEMFREFVVLFVGYSHSHPVMRYLARSFVGGTARFALTLNDRDEHWMQLGIVPVHFPPRPQPDEFGAIDDAIENWTTLSLGWVCSIIRLASAASWNSLRLSIWRTLTI